MTLKVPLPDVGRRLSAIRLQRGLAQGSVARRAGIAPSYLSRIEGGKIQPTFRTVLRVAGALKANLAEIMGPEPAVDERGSCPITTKGQCLLDLIHSEGEASRSSVKRERYTPREIRLLRRLATWMRTVKPDRFRAMEILLEELMQVRQETDGPA